MGSVIWCSPRNPLVVLIIDIRERPSVGVADAEDSGASSTVQGGEKRARSDHAWYHFTRKSPGWDPCRGSRIRPLAQLALASRLAAGTARPKPKPPPPPRTLLPRAPPHGP